MKVFDLGSDPAAKRAHANRSRARPRWAWPFARHLARDNKPKSVNGLEKILSESFARKLRPVYAAALWGPPRQAGAHFEGLPKQAHKY
jgi:hypothetical protein